MDDKGKGKEKMFKFDLNEDYYFEEDENGDDDNLNEGCFVESRIQEMSDGNVNALEFESHCEAYNFYISYALVKGFGVRKNTIQRNKRDGRVRLQIFVCSREGERSKQKDELYEPKREARGESRVNCEAHMRIKFNKKKDKFVVASFKDDHNYAMTPPEHVMFIRSHRSINSLVMREAQSMHKVRISTSKIMDFMVEKYKGYKNCGFLQKDLNNVLDSDYKEKMINGDADATLAYLSAKRDSDPSYYYRYKCDDENRLDMLFWPDGKSRDDYSIFGDVLAFDTTYQTNIYNRPFVMLVGINNHYQTMMYGCALLPNELESIYR